MVNEKQKDTHVWSRLFWHLMCISISLVQTDACNIISWSTFTGISLQPLHYSIQRGKQLSAMTRGTLMESYSVTVVTTTWAWCIWCSTETGLVLLRGIRGHCKLTSSPFLLRCHTRDIWCGGVMLLLQPSDWFQKKKKCWWYWRQTFVQIKMFTLQIS